MHSLRSIAPEAGGGTDTGATIEAKTMWPGEEPQVRTMFIEHFFFSTAIAIIVGMVFFHYTGRDDSWIIIASALAPDLDAAVDIVYAATQWMQGADITQYEAIFYHGTFHNTASVFVYAAILSLILSRFGIPRLHAFALGAIGFASHLFCDALVYKPGYPLLWPFYDQGVGLAILPRQWDLFFLANGVALTVGFATLVAAMAVRMAYERRGRTPDGERTQS
jgi:hypothetical protein